MRQQNDTYTRSLPGLNVPKGHGRAKGPETTRKARKSAKAPSPAPTPESASTSFSQTAFQGLLHESPACTQEKFAELTGLTKRAVECQVQRNLSEMRPEETRLHHRNAVDQAGLPVHGDYLMRVA